MAGGMRIAPIGFVDLRPGPAAKNLYYVTIQRDPGLSFDEATAYLPRSASSRAHDCSPIVSIHNPFASSP